jgi:enoyl-CoA hydratase/carnithine racemase
LDQRASGGRGLGLEALEGIAAAQAAMAETHDHLEGVTAFAEKREARFEGR